MWLSKEATMTNELELGLDRHDPIAAGSARAIERDASPARVRREIEIDAPPEEVWEALAGEEGRERWLDQPERPIVVEVAEEPSRLVWWWGGEGERPTRVEFELIPAAAGTRVVVTESAPEFPIAMLAEHFAAVLV
jgi:hypothetical protein